jgi:RNA polymerase sigma-70 factor (ECF subfamily)
MLQRHESVTLAFLVLLETLSPEERAVFLLKEVFDYSHDEIGEMLQMTAANARQLLHRAKEHVADRRPRFSVDSEAKRETAKRFVAALTANDASALTDLLAEDVGFWADGGGKVTTARRPLRGRAAVLNLLLGLHRIVKAQGLAPSLSFEIIDVNFEPALVVRNAGRLDSIYALSIEGNAIAAIRVVRNPEKLTFIERQMNTRVH